MDLGLTLLQAKIYLALSKTGKATIKTISKASNSARQDIYRIMPTLQKLGLAEKIIAGRPYKSYSDFTKRCNISEKLLKGLIVADAFREFKINKKDAFNNKIYKEQDINQSLLFPVKKQEAIENDFTDIELSQLIYKLTTLTPQIDIKQTYNFGKYNFVDIDDLKNREGGKQYFVRGIITDVLNKDKLLRAETVKHTHSFERHLIYLNLNDGTGNIACQINPETYEKFSNVIGNVKKQPVIVLGKSSKDGKKIYLDAVQIIGDNKTDFIDKLYEKIKYCDKNQAFILSAHPAVSKNGKSYYRILLSNDIEGLCFRFKEKLFPGQLVKYSIDKEPFINLEILEN
jgi:DNA polymerase III alpha subunit